MRIFLTGASGFVGSFFLKEVLSSANHEVSVLIRDPKSAWRVLDNLKDVQLIQGTLSDTDTYKNRLKEFKPDVIVHLAWGGVSNSSRNDNAQWRNVGEMLELLEFSAKLGVKSFVGLGSQAEYGPVNSRVDENVPTNPTTLYGVSKLAACNLGKMLASSMNVKFSWLRLFSSYGPTDSPDWLIPYVINTLLKGESPKLTPAEQIWDYINVRDVARAILAVVDSDNAAGIFNLGSGQSVPLREIIERTKEFTGVSTPLLFGEVPYRTDQVMHLEANIDSLTAHTGWKPVISLEEGLKETVDWWKLNQGWT